VLGERAVIERQDKVAGLVANSLDRMAMSFGEVPQIAGLEIVDLASPRRLKDHSLAAPVNHIGPFGRYGVPVQFARSPGVEKHMHARNPLADGELVDGCFFGPAAGRDLGVIPIERVPEIRHGCDVLRIVVGDRWTWRQLVHPAPETAIAWIAMVMLDRGGLGELLEGNEPSRPNSRSA
jgi:hypothetical protein